MIPLSDDLGLLVYTEIRNPMIYSNLVEENGGKNSSRLPSIFDRVTVSSIKKMVEKGMK